MEMRVEQLSVRAGVPVDTVRYYQSKGLLTPPRREGRVAWYDDSHLERLARIRALQQRGFTLATIVRLVDGELDAADEALIGELSGLGPPAAGADTEHTVEAETAQQGQSGPGTGWSVDVGGRDPSVVDEEDVFTLAELATETGVPLALLQGRGGRGAADPPPCGGPGPLHDRGRGRVAGRPAPAGVGNPALRAARPVPPAPSGHREGGGRGGGAVLHPRTRPRLGRRGKPSEDGRRQDPDSADGSAAAETEAIDQLLRAYDELLPAVTTLVGHHFTRALMTAALDHVEQVASDEERRAIWEQIGVDGDEPAVATGRSETAVRVATVPGRRR